MLSSVAGVVFDPVFFCLELCLVWGSFV
jgi:hypothetical protein